MPDTPATPHPHAPRGSDGYDVLAKWSSPSFDDATRAALAPRLAPPPPPSFFDPETFAALEAACARLLATPLGEPPLAHWIDADVAAGRGEGFRNPEMPPLQATWRQGTAGLQAQAQRRFGRSFAELAVEEQDAVLRSLQQGDAPADEFPGGDPARFFKHVLLKAAAAHFYAQPVAWNEVGFGGPASPRGYVRIELNRRDPWEAPFAPVPGPEQ
ncbi:MAG TPA: gluconate 2-dehydrogenase subunit 3 family protein [Caulobacteraceae bacterium]|jgi:hypothetical protein|nr:gluconate 2-dehydrogenase subunit 3 family protein [Caulobacteraceae bacterium]